MKKVFLIVLAVMVIVVAFLLVKKSEKDAPEKAVPLNASTAVDSLGRRVSPCIVSFSALIPLVLGLDFYP